MTALQLRTADQSDAEAIRACIVGAYADAMRDIADLPDVAAGIGEDIETSKVLVAERGMQILGVVVFAPKADAMMIFNLAVCPDAQGQGIAGQLLSAAETNAAESGLSILRLRTHRKMGATRAMYRHLGWQEVDAKGNAIMMQKPVR